MRVPVRWCLTMLTVTATAVGCSSPAPGPTAAQAGQTVQAHITWLMRHSGFPDFQVTDPGGSDVPCGEDGAKRTFAARATFRGDDAGVIDRMTGALTANEGYKVDRVFAPESEKTILRLRAARTVITLDMPNPGEVTAVGETDCVPRR